MKATTITRSCTLLPVLVNIPLTLLARARTAGLASDMTEAARRPGAGRRQPAGIFGSGSRQCHRQAPPPARNKKSRRQGQNQD